MNIFATSLLGALLQASFAFGDPNPSERMSSEQAEAVRSPRPAVASAQSVPSAGTVESVSGEVLRATQSGWVPVQPGERLADGARIQLLKGASLTVRYASGEVLVFKPAPSQRSLMLTVSQKR